MSYNRRHNANSNFNNAYNDQPSLLGNNINKAEKDKLIPDASGTIRDGYTAQCNEVQMSKAKVAIKRFIINEFKGDLANEVKTNEVYRFANTFEISDEDLLLPQPVGAGPKPVYVDNNNPTDDEKFSRSRWEKRVERLDKSSAANHEKYRAEFMQAVGQISTKFLSPSVLTSIEKNKDFIKAQDINSNMINFLQVLQDLIVKIVRGVKDEQLLDERRTEIREAIITLQISEFRDSLLWIQCIEDLLVNYKVILVKYKMKKLPNGLTVQRIAEWLEEYTEEVHLEVDREEPFIKRFYWEYYKHGLHVQTKNS